MNTILLVFDGIDMDLRRIADIFDKADFFSEKLVAIEQPGGRLYVCEVIPIEEGTFDDWPDSRIPDEPRVFSVDFRAHAAVEDLVKGLARHHRFFVDNNFGRVYSQDEFLTAAADPSRRWWQEEVD